MGSNRAVLAVLIFAVSVVGLGMGATLPVVALRMYQMQAPTLLIGLLAAMPAVGMMVSAFMIEGLCRRFTRRGLYLLALGLCAASVAAIEPLAASPWALGAARALMGVGMGVVIILGESWVNEMSPVDARGRLVALYATCFTACQMLGPASVAWLGAEGPWVSLLVLASLALGLALIGWVMPATPALREQQGRGFSVLGFVKVAPALCMGVLLFSFFDSVVLAMFPVYAAALGFSLGLAALTSSVILAGDAACQLPLGWLADRSDRPRLYLACGLLMVVIGAALPWLMGSGPWLWPALIVLGAVAGGVYTLAIVLIGERFEGADLVTANASAGLIWGIGSVLGPLASGAAMGVGQHGLPWTLAASAGLFVVIAWRMQRRQRHALALRAE
ncbi:MULTISPECIES: MFS transporter [unclassified Pseudomonas]|uniref:MFS transporter n=1 Tax=unclassified Pseudomonas TaxID=196821 RepID=UPI000BD46629|nr:MULTISPECIES: MFS transporter [unclassified Pseudomonas]PVZ12311.1 cyanate permease [Pseudomonas sp. URIL14HWK12:I12]PVZ23537.1 cyanate permease [Pseudomonas sp. URIL14HWK12:I10]PVZ32867.1 cyanate permease [Pseudomonas sp. URIL14HWK12:I11]SNZ14287.1 Cyanate permease [Pseudomonas sp. URIL14HWK12:I9]